MTPTSLPFLELHREHAVVCRNWGAVQERCSRVIAEQSARIAELEAQVLQLRAEALVTRTRQLWALPQYQALLRHHPVATAAQAVFRADWNESNAVLCQVACVSHGSFWLDADGMCQRSATPCAVQAAEEVVQRLGSSDNTQEI